MKWTLRKVLYLSCGLLSIIGVAIVQRVIAVAPIIVVLAGDCIINGIIPGILDRK